MPVKLPRLAPAGCYKAEYQVFQEFCTVLFLHYELMSYAQTMSQDNRIMPAYTEEWSTDVWQSRIIRHNTGGNSKSRARPRHHRSHSRPSPYSGPGPFSMGLDHFPGPGHFVDLGHLPGLRPGPESGPDPELGPEYVMTR